MWAGKSGRTHVDWENVRKDTLVWTGVGTGVTRGTESGPFVGPETVFKRTSSEKWRWPNTVEAPVLGSGTSRNGYCPGVTYLRPM